MKVKVVEIACFVVFTFLYETPYDGFHEKWNVAYDVHGFLLLENVR